MTNESYEIEYVAKNGRTRKLNGENLPSWWDRVLPWRDTDG